MRVASRSSAVVRIRVAAGRKGRDAFAFAFASAQSYRMYNRCVQRTGTIDVHQLCKYCMYVGTLRTVPYIDSPTLGTDR